MERIKNLLRASAFALCALLGAAACSDDDGTARTPARCSAPTRSTERYPIHQAYCERNEGIVSFVFSPLVKSDGQLTTLFLLRAGRCLHRASVARPPLPQRRLHLRLRGSVPLLFALPQSRRAVRPTCRTRRRSLSGEARHHAARRQVVLLRFRRPAGGLRSGRKGLM